MPIRRRNFFCAESIRRFRRFSVNGPGSPAQPPNRQNPSQDGNDTTSHVRQRCDVRVKGRGEQRAENARQAAGALRDTDGRALLVRGREVGQQSEKRRPLTSLFRSPG